MLRGFAFLGIAIALLGLPYHLSIANFVKNDYKTQVFPHGPPYRPAKVLVTRTMHHKDNLGYKVNSQIENGEIGNKANSAQLG